MLFLDNIEVKSARELLSKHEQGYGLRVSNNITLYPPREIIRVKYHGGTRSRIFALPMQHLAAYFTPTQTAIAQK